jgi:hypothetical protein
LNLIHKYVRPTSNKILLEYVAVFRLAVLHALDRDLRILHREDPPVRVPVRAFTRETQRMLTTGTAQVLDVAEALPPYPAELAAAPSAYAAK